MKTLSLKELNLNSRKKISGNNLKTCQNDYEVYWIHRNDQHDLHNEGYIGITKQGIENRFYTHCKDSKNGSDNVVHRAIRKYWDCIVVDVICICDESYARYLERSLRPSMCIGWNIVAGGGGGVDSIINLIGREEWGNRISVGKKMSFQSNPQALKEHGKREYYKDSSYKERQSHVQKEVHKNNPHLAKEHSERMKAKKPWENSKVNKDVWKSAKYYYELFKTSDLSPRQQSIKNGLSPDGLRKIYEHFKSGWNPNKDPEWEKWRIKYE